jgi:hypothetical protein
MRANLPGQAAICSADFDCAVLSEDFELKLSQRYGTTGAVASLMLVKQALSSS